MTMYSIAVKNLSYTYPDGKRALNNLSIEIEEGAKVALVGHNGSGKTTLLLHLNGLLDGKGDIEIAGIKRNKKNIPVIRKKTGLLLNRAEYNFIMPDLLSDILLSVPVGIKNSDERRNIAMQWLKRFSIEQYAASNPMDLSSGEMKKGAMAGIFAMAPEVVLLDEPLSNLDRPACIEVIDILSGMNQTILMATHQRILAEKLATHIAVIERGEITGLYPKDKALLMDEVNNLLL